MEVLRCVRCPAEVANRLRQHVERLVSGGCKGRWSRDAAVVLPSVLPFSVASVLRLVVRSVFMPTSVVLAVHDQLNSRDDLGGPDSAHFVAMTALRA